MKTWLPSNSNNYDVLNPESIKLSLTSQSDDEIDRIRVLFEKAGIATDKYKALS